MLLFFFLTLPMAFGAAYVIGYFDDIAEMHKIYDRYKGKNRIVIQDSNFRLE